MALIDSLMPPQIDGPIYLALVGASFLSSFITIAFGIGGGTLLLAIMAAVVPPAALIPVHGMVQFASNSFRMAVLVRFVHWPALRGFAVGSVLGCALGGAIAVELPPRLIQAGVGVFIIWSVIARPPEWIRRWPPITGGLSSFLTMFFGATGVFVANYTRSFELDRHRHVASHAALMTVQHLLKVVVFGLLGFSLYPWIGVVAAMILFGFAGTLAGRILLGRMSDLGFRRALNVVLVLISFRLIWIGIAGG